MRSVATPDIVPGWRRLWLGVQQDRVEEMMDELLELEPVGWEQAAAMVTALDALARVQEGIESLVGFEEGSTR